MNKQKVNYEKIHKELVKLIKDCAIDNSRVAKVKAVGLESCAVECIDDASIIEGVRLKATINKENEGVIITPKVGSYIIVSGIGNSDQMHFVSMYTEVTAITINMNGQSIVVDKNGTVWNGGKNGGFCIVPELKTQLEKLTKRVDDIISAMGKGVPSPGDGGAALIAGINGYLSAITEKEDFSGIENKKVKH